MNDKITAVIVNLNSLVNRLEWIKQQNYNDPDAVDLMGDVAEWVCEIDEAVEAIEKSLTPARSKGESVGQKPGLKTTHPFIPSQEGNYKLKMKNYK